MGVKDCDSYLERYDDCVKTLSDEEQEARAAERQTMRNVLREEAQRPESKDKVAEYCKAALAALKDCT